MPINERKGTRGGDNGEKYKRSYRKEIIIGVVSLFLGGGGGTTVQNLLNPQKQFELLKQDYHDYKISHQREEELKDKMINQQLEVIKEDVKEIKSLIIKGGN